MKVFISADMEGIAGVSSWDDVNPEHARYPAAQEQMTAEVAAACEGAYAAGAKEIWVRDAHWAAANLIAEKLPAGVKLIRGWSRHPYMMVQEIDPSFDAAVFVGYHSHAGSGANPLSHTIETHISWIKVNGQFLSEFRLYAAGAALENVPVVFLSGDKGVCEEARKLCPEITTLPILEGKGTSTVSLSPLDSPKLIRDGVKKALGTDLKKFPRLPMKGPFDVEVRYDKPTDAFKFSHFPGGSLKDDHTVAFKLDNSMDLMRWLMFVC